MKKIIIFVICIFLFNNIHAIDYAILISGGEATTDDAFSNSEYWYDIFLAYEDLVLNEGYNPANVFVFYGNGTDFNATTYNRYRPALHGWATIVDFDNAYNTLNTEFANLAGIITTNDNLVIRWVVGHGAGNPSTALTIPGNDPNMRIPINNDDYWALLQNRNLWIRETEIIRIINQINNYKRRKIIWMTCHSGCLTGGTNNLNNNGTVIITSSRWDQPSFPYWLPNETIHAELNYIVTSALFGEDPLGTAFDADNNGDNVINMWELWNEADINPIMSSDPQLGDNGSLAHKIFVNEDLILENIDLSNTYEYWVETITVRNLSISNSGNVKFEPDVEIIIERNFETELGGVLEIK